MFILSSASHPHWPLAGLNSFLRVARPGGYAESSPGLHTFGWQDGYAAFTVGKSNLAEVVQYVQNQRKHHRTKTFQEEYRAFLEAHGIQRDERYLWG